MAKYKVRLSLNSGLTLLIQSCVFETLGMKILLLQGACFTFRLEGVIRSNIDKLKTKISLNSFLLSQIYERSLELNRARIKLEEVF